MRFHDYDGLCVRIVDSSGDIFEGICSYNGPEYNEHEFGRSEESLRILNFLFFKSCVRDVESLEGHEGPYGRFSAPFGNIEEMTVEDGIESIGDVLFSEETEHVYRLLLCLERYLAPGSRYTLPYRDEVIDALEELLTVNQNDKIREETECLLEIARGKEDL